MSINCKWLEREIEPVYYWTHSHKVTHFQITNKYIKNKILLQPLPSSTKIWEHTINILQRFPFTKMWLHINNKLPFSTIFLSTFTLLYNHHHHPSPEFSPTPLLAHTTWQSPIYFLSLDMTMLGTSHKGNRMLFFLLCLAYHNVFMVHPHLAWVRISFSKAE